MSEGTLYTHRSNGGNAAVVFVHGFSGDPQKTWGQFPQLLSARRSMRDWDVHSLGFPTSLGCDIVGIWKAEPDIAAIGGGIHTRLASDRALADCKAIALVAHSMGGLAVQRALVDYPDLARRVDSVILFGTPSGGLKKASFVKFWKRQLLDMADDGVFIKDLRARWAEKFGTKRPFQFVAVAGDQDEFVPRESSHWQFAKADCEDVPGDHLAIVKPDGPNVLSVDVVERKLTRGHADPESASRAAERVQARANVEQRLALHAELGEAGLVQLALALEQIGEMEKAIEILQRAKPEWYDARGVLAGRLKRRWLLLGRDDDGRQSLEIYSDAYQRAAAAGKDAAAFYNGVNAAFLELTYGDDLAKARAIAQDVLSHCKTCERDQKSANNWQLATEGEAQLYLGQPRVAISKYKDAVAETTEARQKDSMYQQASRITSVFDDRETAAELDRVFGRAGET